MGQLDAIDLNIKKLNGYDMKNVGFFMIPASLDFVGSNIANCLLSGDAYCVARANL